MKDRKRSKQCKIIDFIIHISLFIYYNLYIMPKQAKLLLTIWLIVISTYCHIYSSDSTVKYDYGGNPLSYHIFLSMDKGIGANDYLKINWPLRLHSSTDKSVVMVKLISFSNNL